MPEPDQPVITEEQHAEFDARCKRVEQSVEGLTLDEALMALTAVTARLCASHELAAETCVTTVEDLLASFRDEIARLNQGKS